MPVVDDFGRGLGLRREEVDRRDRALFAATINIDSLPDKGSAANLLPAPLDQEMVNACVGFSGSTALAMIMKNDKHLKPFVPSPVWLYRQARELGGYVEEDSGAEIRLMWKAANRLGLVPMSNLKPRFDAVSTAKPNVEGVDIFPEKSIWRRPVSASNLADAQRRQVIQYFKLFNLGDLLKCIADGWPVQAGIEVWRSFYGPGGPNYIIPDPKTQPNDYLMGLHAVVAYEYDKPSRSIFWRNSWGKFPHEGKPDFVTSFDFVQPYVTDAWTGRLIEGGIYKPPQTT